MLDFLRSFFLLLNAIKMDPCLLSNKERHVLMRSIEPLHRKHLLVLHFDLYLQLQTHKIKKQLPLSRIEEQTVPFVVVDKLVNAIILAKVDDFEVLLMHDIHDGLVICDCYVSAEIEEVFGLSCEPLLDFLELLVLLRVDQLQEVLIVLHNQLQYYTQLSLSEQALPLQLAQHLGVQANHAFLLIEQVVVVFVQQVALLVYVVDSLRREGKTP